ncbi:MAG TPA: hypothetical protein VGQ12_04195 [Candidatus Angelobacter sp.]|nr:hypothetical protein [Candidatus Angelobacter sp.]
MTSFTDVRRRVAYRAHGALRFLDDVQGGIADIEGAIAERQYDVAAFAAHYLAVACLSIRSLERAGEIAPCAGSVSFDVFEGLASEEITAGLALANEACSLDEQTAATWLNSFRLYVAETERLLGYDAPLLVLRSLNGPFVVIGMIRRWSALLDELNLPGLLPSSWVTSKQPPA